MKRIVIIIALAMLIKPIVPVVDYVVNYDYISKVLCVNKAKPQMHCNGKCHLMKELAKAAESEKPISSDKKDSSKQETELLFFLESPKLVFQPHFFLIKSSPNYNYSNLYTHLECYSIFHPPIFS